MAKKWQKLAASRRKRISFPRSTRIVRTKSCSPSSIIEKGHFVVYSSDQRRFVIPLKYLENNIMKQLFEIAEDEFGLPSSGPITLPCNALFIKYVICLIQRGAAKDVEKALLITFPSSRCYHLHISIKSKAINN